MRALPSNIRSQSSNMRALSSNIRALPSIFRDPSPNIRALSSNIRDPSSNIRALSSNVRALSAFGSASLSLLRAPTLPVRGLSSCGRWCCWWWVCSIPDKGHVLQMFYMQFVQNNTQHCTLSQGNTDDRLTPLDQYPYAPCAQYGIILRWSMKPKMTISTA